MDDIEFSIGPHNKEQHDFVYSWLVSNFYNIKGISSNGDHYSEIHIYGDYNKAYIKLGTLKHISFEHWD